MKKFLIIFACLMISILFVSCSSQNSPDKSTIQFSSSILSNETEENSNKDNTEVKDNVVNPYNDGSNIEKVIIYSFGEKMEATYDENAHNLFEEIKTCDKNSAVSLTDEIGKICLKYKDKDSIDDFAKLYISTDYNIYAQHISESNCLYKIDLGTFDR